MQLYLDHLHIDFIPTQTSQVWKSKLPLESPQLIHIMAASGQGKSSLVQILYGLHHQYQGNYSIDGKSAKDIPIEAWCELRAQKLSIVFQDLQLLPQQTAFDNIDIKRQLHEFYPLGKIKEMAEQLGVSHTLQRPVQTLSYGERQRIAIIRALMQPFSWLFLDEPFSHLDENNTLKAAALIMNECQVRQAGMLKFDLGLDSFFPYHQIIHL